MIRVHFPFLSFLLFILCNYSFAQSSLVVTAKDDAAFKLLINNIEQGSGYYSKVVINQIPFSLFDCKVVFQNPAIPPIEKRIWWDVKDIVASYSIYQNKAKEWALSLTKYEKVTTGKVYPSSYVIFPLSLSKKQEVDIVDEADTLTLTNPVTLPSSPPVSSCRVISDTLPIGGIIMQIESIPFEVKKIEDAELLLKNKCVSVSQVSDLLPRFDFDESKLRLAKYLYPFTVDKKNYSRLLSLFTFESNAQQLKNFIDSSPR